jgi:molecular chaperone GrpE (heat shock protein)
MTNDSEGFFSRLRQAATALAGAAPAPGADEALPDEPALLKARIRALSLDIAARDDRIKAMQQEFAQLSRQAEAERAGAGGAEMLALARRLAPILSQAPTMRAMHGEGKELRVADLLRLFDKVEGIFREAGLEPIGAVRSRVAFDSRLHQRMSGGDIGNGATATVRFVGYRLGDAILTKAMVSREDDDAHRP